MWWNCASCGNLDKTVDSKCPKAARHDGACDFEASEPPAGLSLMDVAFDVRISSWSFLDVRKRDNRDSRVWKTAL